MCTQGSSKDDSNPSPSLTLPRMASGMPHNTGDSSCHQGVLSMRTGWAHQDMQKPIQSLTLILKKHGLGERWAPQQTPLASISTSGLTSQSRIPPMSLFRGSLSFPPPLSLLFLLIANLPINPLYSRALHLEFPLLHYRVPGDGMSGKKRVWGEGLHTRTPMEDSFHLSFGTWHRPPTSCLRLSTDSSFPLS